MRDHLTEGSKLEIGDEDPRKVNPSPPVGDELVPDSGANLPDTHDISRGIVSPEPTNPLMNIYEVFDLIVVCYQQTISLKKLEDRWPIIVGRYKTILKSEVFGKVINKARELQVFAIPTIIYTLNLPRGKNRTYVYDIISDLESDGLVIPTQFKVQKPDPSTPGEAPNFYRFTDIEVNDREDPIVRKAQKEYEVALLKYKPSVADKLSAINRQLENCRSTTDYYVIHYEKMGRVGKHHAPFPLEVETLIRQERTDIPPDLRTKMANQISKDLYGLPRVAEPSPIPSLGDEAPKVEEGE